MTTDTDNFRDCDTDVLFSQIGYVNLIAISGLRGIPRRTGITLPVSNGYRVTVDLDANDTYVVRRVFARGTKTWIKGELRGVHCDDVGEAAYQASCFHNGEFGDGAA